MHKSNDKQGKGKKTNVLTCVEIKIGRKVGGKKKLHEMNRNDKKREKNPPN